MFKNFLMAAIVACASLLTVPVAFCADEALPFPAYGDGPVEVRLYSNYFCPPCGALEPRIEPLLKDLVKNKIIRLIMVDIPAGADSLLYNHFFLYALKVENNFERALAVREVLFEAARSRNILSEEALEDLFNENGILYEPFDPAPLLPRFNALIKADELQATPTIVVVRDGEKNLYTGRRNITGALEELNKPDR